MTTMTAAMMTGMMMTGMMMTMTMGATTMMGAVMTDRPRFRPSFRLRVLGSVAALLVVAAVGGLLLQRTFLLRGLEREVASALEQEREELQTLAGGHNPLTGERFGDDVQAIFDTFLRRNLPEEGEVYIAFLDGEFYRTTLAPLRLDADPDLVARWGSLAAGERGEIGTEEGPVQYLAVPLLYDGVTRGVFVIANFTQGEREEIESAVRIEAAVSAFVLLMVTLVAWFLSGRLLRPIQDLTETAEAISDSDLTRRIPVEGDDEISRLAQTFNEMLDRLEESFTAQRRFIDDAGHELRTPITIIRGHLDLLGDDPEEPKETMAIVDDELSRMARIVDDLLVLAKAEQPDFIRREMVELTDLTTELLAKSRTLGLRDWRLDACAEGIIHADADRVTQAMLNLARNAVEHTPPGAEIGVGSSWSDDGVRLWVRDTGIGIDPTEQDRIFDRFARARAGRRSEGAGLGLAIVRTIALSHGGWVELESEPGKGATFTMFLPGTPPSEAPTVILHTGLETQSDPVDQDATKRTATWPGS
jgi:two-component system, OmpR family, sensor kinase